MRTNSRSRGRGLVLAVLSLIASLPELARAQQTGLFPNMPIKRQRVACDQEDPIYKIYKHQYFGYHPTCWRTFPSGWGCPSPEAPDKAKSFKELPLASGDNGERADDKESEDGAMPGQSGVTRPTVPPIQGGARSPFEEPADTDKPGANPRNPRGAPTPLPTPPGDPFEMDNPAAPAAPRAGQARPGSASNGPELSAPADRPGSIQGARSSRNEIRAEPENSEEEGPLLALPGVNLPPVEDAGVPFGTRIPSQVASAAPADAGSSTPRRGLISGFFNNLGINWARR